LQVFSNLLGNALKFTPREGNIVVRAAQSGDDRVRFEIRDTGPGIEAQHLDRVFDRYWQGGREVRQGAGLGLAIAKRIVIGRGGRIGVESTLGGGSTFWFEIPERPKGESPAGVGESAGVEEVDRQSCPPGQGEISENFTENGRKLEAVTGQ